MRRPTVTDEVYAAIEDAMAEVATRAAADRDAAVQHALQQAAVLNREQLGTAATGVQADLAAKKDVIDTRLDEVRTEVRAELQRLGALVSELGTASAQRFGQVDESLRAHAEVAGTLADSTRSLREALANPQARGQWGERMAEDVLRLAGFTEHVNYRKQTQVAGGTGPARTTRSSCPRATSSTWTSSSRWRRTCATSRSAPMPSARPT